MTDSRRYGENHGWMRTPLFSTAVLLCAASVVLGAATTSGVLTEFDKWGLAQFVMLRAPWLTAVFTAMAAFFSPLVSVVFAACAAGMIRVVLKQWAPALAIMVAVIGSALATRVFKVLCGRARPDELGRLVEETSFSFPSGHATGVAACAVSVALIVTMWRTVSSAPHHASARAFVAERTGQSAQLLGVGLSLRWQILTWFVAIGLIALVCVSRLYLGVHWPSDVVGGVCVGAAFSCASIAFFNRPRA